VRPAPRSPTSLSSCPSAVKGQAEYQARQAKREEKAAAAEAEDAKKRARAERFGVTIGDDEGPSKKAKN
jgi:hypothetical protein